MVEQNLVVVTHKSFERTQKVVFLLNGQMEEDRCMEWKKQELRGVEFVVEHYYMEFVLVH